jgi:putative transcription factor
MIKMSECKLCGKEGTPYKAKIEGAILDVCEDCIKFGKKIEIKKPFKKKIYKAKELPETILIENYGKLITEKRIGMGLERKHFALKINEKESLIKKIELEQIRPADKLVKKIENFLGVTLTTSYEPAKSGKEKKTGTLTLGDIISLD